jgi:stringent starvation protein A
MALVASKRSVMTLYSDPLDIYCHRVRFVLAEKGITAEVIDVIGEDKPEDLIDLNPYNTVPTLIDRDLVIYESHIIMEYLDERFPHPPLMPVYPVARAENRQMIYRIDRDLYPLLSQIEANSDDAKGAKKQLEHMLVNIAPLFAQKPFFLSDEFSLLDCVLAPLLWRLPAVGVTLPASAKPLLKYSEKIFKRDAFHASLSESEQELCD